MQREHPGLQLLSLIAFEVIAVVGLTWIGSVPRWRVDWAHFWTWLQAAPAEDAIAGVLRWVALGLAWWLLATSILYCLARLSRIPALMRGTGWLTLPFVRAAVDRALVVTLAASTMVGARAGAAFAQSSTAPGGSVRAVATASAAPGWNSSAAPSAAPATPAAADPGVTTIGVGGTRVPVRLAAAEAPANPTEDQLAAAVNHPVVSDDNLWSICTGHLAEVSGRDAASLRPGEISAYWWAVVDANRSTIRSGNPNLIFAGEVVQLLPVISTPDGFAAGAPVSVAPGSAGRSTTATTPAPDAAPSPSVVGPPAAPAPTTPPPTVATAPATTAVPPTTAATAPPTTVAPPTTAVTPSTSAAALPNGAIPVPAPSGQAPTTASVPTAPPSSTPAPTVPAPVPASGATVPTSLRAAARTAASTTTVATDNASAARAKVRRGGWSLARDFPIHLDGVGLLGAGLLGAGVIGTLDRMRRRQRRWGRVLLPDVELAGRELALRVGADPKGAAFVDVALRAMAAQLRESDQEVPDILGVELARRTMTVFLAAPAAPPPPGFTARDGGRRWVLSRGVDTTALDVLAEGVPAPCPALVSVGRSAEGGTVLLDLEQVALTTAIGDRAAASALLAAAALELATSEWADFVSLVLVGFGDELAGLERVRLVSSVAEVIGELESEAAEIAAALEQSGCASTLEARVRGEVPDAWVPTIVLCHKRPPARVARRLASVATKAGNAGVGVLVAGELDGAWELVCEGHQMMVGPLGFGVVPHGLAPEDSAAVGALFEIALSDEAVGDEDLDADDIERDDVDEEDVDEENVGDGAETSTSDDTPDDDDERDPHPRGSTPSSDGPPAVVLASGVPPELAALDPLRGYGALLGIMGPLELWGGEKPVTRAMALELIAYLALHPSRPIDAERLMDVLSPEWRLKEAPEGKRHPAAVTLNTTTTVARGCLGRRPDGGFYLPHLQGNGTRHYRLDGVGLDYQVFCDQCHRASLAEASGDFEAAAEALRVGLALVRGVPFEGVVKEDDGTRPFQWVFVEGVFYKVERDIADAAHRLAVLRLSANDSDGASWAAGRGLLASPGDRLLTHDLMLAGGMARNPGAVEAALRQLGDLVEQDEPYDKVDAATMAVYREQMARAVRRDEADEAGDPPAGTNGHHPVRRPLASR